MSAEELVKSAVMEAEAEVVDAEGSTAREDREVCACRPLFANLYIKATFTDGNAEDDDFEPRRDNRPQRRRFEEPPPGTRLRKQLNAVAESVRDRQHTLCPYRGASG